MIEVKKGLETVHLPYTIRLYGVSEARFDELVDEDTKAELIDGVMIVHSPASMEHDDSSGFLRALMSFYADDKGLGKVLGPDSLVRLGANRRCAPDVFFVQQRRLPLPLPREFDGLLRPNIRLVKGRTLPLSTHTPLTGSHSGVDLVWSREPQQKSNLSAC